MSLSTSGVLTLVGMTALALALAMFDRRRRGRFRSARHSSAEYVEWQNRLGRHLGQDVTFVQFSSAFCAPCRATRLTLADVAERDPGVAHIEIDAESHLDLVRELNILSTPTTIVLDAKGATVARSVGAPRKDQVLLLVQGIRNSQSSSQ